MIWYVAVGSAVGGAARFFLTTLVQQRAGTGFPLGTLVVNVTGSFLLGILWRYSLGVSGISAEMRLLLTAGFCGGYTTFSTFSYEALVLLEEGELARGGLYVVASVVLSLGATWIGFLAARGLLMARANG